MVSRSPMLCGRVGAEAVLAREAELCYATVAMVSDFDSWRDGDQVDVATILSVIAANAARGARLVEGIATGWNGIVCGHDCACALDNAIMTDRAHWPAAAIARLQGSAGWVLA